MSIPSRYHDVMKSLADVDADRVLAAWIRRSDAGLACFGTDWEKLSCLRASASDARTVAFLSYENPKGASGGILAVIRRLPAEMRKYLEHSSQMVTAPLDLIRISPLHSRLKTKYDSLTAIGICNVIFNKSSVTVTVYEAVIANDERWHLFSADGFFEADGGTGGTDPYTYSVEDQRARNGERSLLLRDALFACKAVPQVLGVIGKKERLVVHAQDWEFASSALTIKDAVLDGTLSHASVVLTLHNPYDHQLSQRELSWISKRHADESWPPLGKCERDTVLTRMIPLLDAPVSVVSHKFAQELRESPIQTGVFTRHQQDVFNYQGLVGIDNGDFVSTSTPAFSSPAVAKALTGDPSDILAEKRTHRRKMLEALARYLDSVDCFNPATPTFGTLAGGIGKPLTDLADDVPVFMMVGRLDPGQKGYDVCARLIESFPNGAARFVLTPMSPLAHDRAVRPFFEQLTALAEHRRGDVVVFAHRMTMAYAETMKGATYGLWPSRYEPFGGVSEFYASGTPVIAHAVGGLVQQVIGYSQVRSEATGFLYDSRLTGASVAEQERQYREAHEASPDRRTNVAVYQRECQLLQETVAAAVDVFQKRPTEYATLLANLSEMRAMLSWQKPVQDYLKWYDVTSATSVAAG